MFVVLQIHLDGKIMGFVEDEEGEITYSDTYEEAKALAEEYCAFDYKIIDVSFTH